MYQMKDFPKERIAQIREECGVLEAQQTRMELLDLIGQEKDQDDLLYIFSMLDEAEKLVEDCRAKARAKLAAEVDAWNKQEGSKFKAEWEAWRAEWRAGMEKAKTDFAKAMGWT